MQHFIRLSKYSSNDISPQDTNYWKIDTIGARAMEHCITDVMHSILDLLGTMFAFVSI